VTGAFVESIAVGGGGLLGMRARRSEVQRDRLVDEHLDLVAEVASRHTAGKVGDMRASGLASFRLLANEG